MSQQSFQGLGVSQPVVDALAARSITEPFSIQELVIPELIDRRGVASTVVEIQHGLPESVLNPIFARAGENYPEVKLGSYPGLPMRIRLSGPPDLVEEAATFVRGELAGLMATDAGAQLAADWTRRLAADEEHLRSAR